MTETGLEQAAPAKRACRVCGADVDADAARCPRCNAALGDLPPCPHCRAIGGVSPDGELRFRCDVCGGPRVPVARGFAPSGREAAHLKAADKARKARAGWRAGAVASGLLVPLLGVVFLLIGLVFGFGVTLFLTAALALAPVVALFALAATRAGAASRQIGPALDAAWVSVAEDVARASAGALSPPELAKRLGIDEAQAEELVALLDVNAIVAPAPAPLRIAVDAPPSPAASDELVSAAAEEEAALADVEAKTEAAPQLKR